MRQFGLYEFGIKVDYASLDLNILSISTEKERTYFLNNMVEWVSSMVKDMELSKLARPTDEAREKFLSVAREELAKLLSLWEKGQAYMSTVCMGRMRLVYDRQNKTLIIGYFDARFGIKEREF